jgi:hypothetical protein
MSAALSRVTRRDALRQLAATGLAAPRRKVSIEQGLLKRVTALAKERRISPSQLLAEALEEKLARSGSRG